MKFVYTPTGADPIKWDYDPGRLMSPEAEAIERHTGLTYGKFIQACGEGSMTAIHGLLYVLLKRQHPTLKYDEVVFCVDEIDFEADDEDVTEDGTGVDGDVSEGDDVAAESDPKA